MFGGIYPSQGILSPVSTIQCCVLPVLQYGVENWVMSRESLRVLERFQGNNTFLYIVLQHHPQTIH